MTILDFEAPQTFECESPLHVGTREVHISEGGCDEIERGLGIALCADCWCKYNQLINEGVTQSAQPKEITEGELVELIAGSPIALRRLIAEMRLLQAKLTHEQARNRTDTLCFDRERAMYMRLCPESKAAIEERFQLAADASRDALGEVFMAQKHLMEIEQ